MYTGAQRPCQYSTYHQTRIFCSIFCVVLSDRQYIFFSLMPKQQYQGARQSNPTHHKVESLGSVPVWVCMLLLSDSNARGEWPLPTDGVGTSSFRRDGSFPSIKSPAIFDGPWSETWDLCFCLLYYLTWSIVGEREFVLGFRFEVTRSLGRLRMT